MENVQVDVLNNRRYYRVTLDDDLGRVVLGPGQFTYDHLVSAIINKKYSTDKMQAIINNYLLDSVAFKEEFDEMQAFRKKAKEIARSLFPVETN